MDLHEEFKKFNDNIKLSDSKEENLITSSDALKDVINSYFKEKGKKCPSYIRQGSFPMKTTLNNLKEKDADYDIDIGVYLNDYEGVDKEDWPQPDTVHGWIFDATNNQTYEPNNNKKACVRVNYKKDYHVDLPIYIKDDDDNTYLAHKDGWTPSEPVYFTEWFKEKVRVKGEQLRRVVRYIKGWRDYKSINLKSICITILVGKYFMSDNDSDHLALIKTLKNILTNLDISFECIKPVTPGEDLFEDENEDLVKGSLKKLLDDLNTLFDTYDADKVNNLTDKIFGNRFPRVYKKDENENTRKPGVLNGEARSA